MSNLECAREENEVLRRQLKTVRSQLKSKEVLTIEIDRLNRTVMEREATITTVRDELAYEKQKRNSEQDTNRRLTRSLRKKQEEIMSKEKEIEGLKAEIQERDKQVRWRFSLLYTTFFMDTYPQLGLSKTKLRALAKLTKAPKSTVQKPDDSLIVEQPLIVGDPRLILQEHILSRFYQGIENAGVLKRNHKPGQSSSNKPPETSGLISKRRKTDL